MLGPPDGAERQIIPYAGQNQSYQKLYHFERQGEETVLVISDPLQFWDISNYLVLEVER